MRKSNLLATISAAALATAVGVGWAEAQISAQETIDFQIAVSSGDLEAMTQFLRVYPTSPFGRHVVDRIVEAVGQEVAADMVSAAQNGHSQDSSIY